MCNVAPVLPHPSHIFDSKHRLCTVEVFVNKIKGGGDVDELERQDSLLGQAFNRTLTDLICEQVSSSEVESLSFQTSLAEFVLLNLLVSLLVLSLLDYKPSMHSKR